MKNNDISKPKTKKIRLLVAADLTVGSFKDAAEAEKFSQELEDLIKEFFDCTHTSSLVQERRGNRPVDLSRMSFRVNKSASVAA